MRAEMCAELHARMAVLGEGHRSRHGVLHGGAGSGPRRRRGQAPGFDVPAGPTRASRSNQLMRLPESRERFRGNGHSSVIAVPAVRGPGHGAYPQYVHSGAGYEVSRRGTAYSENPVKSIQFNNRPFLGSLPARRNRFGYRDAPTARGQGECGRH